MHVKNRILIKHFQRDILEAIKKMYKRKKNPFTCPFTCMKSSREEIKMKDKEAKLRLHQVGIIRELEKNK